MKPETVAARGAGKECLDEAVVAMMASASGTKEGERESCQEITSTVSYTTSTRIHVLAAIFYFAHSSSLVLPCHRHISLPSARTHFPGHQNNKRPVTYHASHAYVDFYICPARCPVSVHMPAAPPGCLVCSWLVFAELDTLQH